MMSTIRPESFERSSSSGVIGSSSVAGAFTRVGSSISRSASAFSRAASGLLGNRASSQEGNFALLEDEGATFQATIKIPSADGKTESVEMDIPEDAESIVQVRVPPNAKPGERMTFSTPKTGRMTVSIPEGRKPGDVMIITIKKKGTIAT